MNIATNVGIALFAYCVWRVALWLDGILFGNRIKPCALPKVDKPARAKIILLPHQKHRRAAKQEKASPVKTLVIGLGGLGGHALTYLRSHSYYKLDTCAVDTNAKDLKHTAALFRILLGKHELKGLGTGIEPSISATLMQDNLPELEGFIELHGYQKIIVVAGAGGGTGSGVLPVILEFLRQKNLGVLPVITMPFDFEGKRKLAIADTMQAMLQESYPGTPVIHQQHLLRDYPQAGFKDALDQSLFEIMQGIENALDILPDTTFKKAVR